MSWVGDSEVAQLRVALRFCRRSGGDAGFGTAFAWSGKRVYGPALQNRRPREGSRGRAIDAAGLSTTTATVIRASRDRRATRTASSPDADASTASRNIAPAVATPGVLHRELEIRSPGPGLQLDVRKILKGHGVPAGPARGCKRANDPGPRDRADRRGPGRSRL